MSKRPADISGSIRDLQYEIDQAIEEAREEGRKEGEEEGYAKGKDVGYKEGEKDGYENCKSDAEDAFYKKEKVPFTWPKLGLAM